jgi:hypothetical protein
MRAGRSKTQPAPPAVIWETLTDPHRPGSRTWLVLEAGEVEPLVLDSQPPSRVVWSSLWPARHDDRICFDIEAHGEGSRLTWSLEVGGGELTDAQFDQMRHRINYLINGEMRLSFGQ